MPSSATITAFYSFTAGTKARASQVNANFNVFRGHFLPIDPNSIASINNTYDLGSTEYKWRAGYITQINSTTISTSSLVATTATITNVQSTSLTSTYIKIGQQLYNDTNGSGLDSSVSIDSSGLKLFALNTTITVLGAGSTLNESHNTRMVYRGLTTANSNTVLHFDGAPGNDPIYMAHRGDSVSARYFKVETTSTSFYLHNPNQSAIFYVDDNGSSKTIYKLASHDPAAWHSFSGSGSWVSNTTYTAKFRKIGDSIDIEYYLALSGAPTSATLTVAIPFSSDWTIDTTKLTSTNHSSLGDVTMSDSGVLYKGSVAYVSTTTLKASVVNVAATYAVLADVTASVPFTFGASDYVMIRIYGIPITNMS